MPQATRERESAKQRALRMPLDYYRRGTRLDRVKYALTFLATLAAGAYVLWASFGRGQAGARQFSPAPVAAPHATWNDRCSSCHVDFVPLRDDASGTALLASFLAAENGSSHAAQDAKCSACHAGPAHHANQIAAEVQSCAGCHREHQGPGADLARVADALCLSCHRQIETHRQGPSIETVASVGDWASHPPFRSIGAEKQAEFRDPGNLKFNHHLHMLPGQFPRDTRQSGPLKLADVDPAHWPSMGYRANSSPDTLIQLDCSYCHELEGAARPGESVADTPKLGAYMLPIRFDRHCAACHERDLLVETAAVQGPLPHGLRAEELRRVMLGLAAGTQSPPPPLSPQRPLAPIPGRTPGEGLGRRIGGDFATQFADAESHLRSEARCGKCHHFGETDDGSRLREAVPPAIPAVWLEHARFDHAAHRGVKCSQCHPAAVPPAGSVPRPPLDGDVPMIPNIDNCRECHNPARGAASGGARFDCVECHRYHGGDLPPHGLGAAVRGVAPARKRTAKEFLSGR